MAPAKMQPLLYEDDDLQGLLAEYKYVFQTELPDCFPSERDLQHTIELVPNSKPPYWILFHLSPAELVSLATMLRSFSSVVWSAQVNRCMVPRFSFRKRDQITRRFRLLIP